MLKTSYNATMNTVSWQRTTEEILDLLRNSGIRLSAQRTGIAQILLHKPQHLCAEEVLLHARNKGMKVSRATVYNTLHLLVKKNLAREISVVPGRIFYDSCAHHHHHFYDEDSGRLFDIQTDDLELSCHSELPAGTFPVGVDIVVRLRCNSDK